MTAPRPRTRPNPLAALAALTAAREAVKAAQEAARLQRIAFLDSLGIKVDPTSDPQIWDLTRNDWNVRSEAGTRVLRYTSLGPGYTPSEQIVYGVARTQHAGLVLYRGDSRWFILDRTRKSSYL